MLREYIIILLKISAIYKAILMGWDVKVIKNDIILRKKINDMTNIDKNITKLMEILLELNN
jgi:uncharacterized protein (UPF0335 family)